MRPPNALLGLPPASSPPIAVQHEYCESAEDFLERRCRMAFLDAKAAVEVVDRVGELMAAQLGWSDERRQEEVKRAKASLGSSFFCKPA